MPQNQRFAACQVLGSEESVHRARKAKNTPIARFCCTYGHKVVFSSPSSTLIPGFWGKHLCWQLELLIPGVPERSARMVSTAMSGCITGSVTHVCNSSPANMGVTLLQDLLMSSTGKMREGTAEPSIGQRPRAAAVAHCSHSQAHDCVVPAS